MNDGQTIVVNGVRITPAITDMIRDWMGTNDEPFKECKPKFYVETLLRVSDVMLDKLEDSYPELDKVTYGIMLDIKSMRQDFEKIMQEGGEA